MDMRVPVLIGAGAELGPGDVALAVADGEATHGPGCDCCVARSEVATALGRLFVARARGDTPWFTRVVASCATGRAEAALRAALSSDPVTSARFRLAVSLRSA